MALIGKAKLTVCRTVSQGYVQVYAGAPAPADILPEDAKRLLKEGYLEKVADSKPEPSSTTGGSTSGPTVDEVLKDVGDDKAKAAAALEAEKARGDDARSTLVSKLQAIVDA